MKDMMNYEVFSNKIHISYSRIIPSYNYLLLFNYYSNKISYNYMERKQ